jgi:5'-3' exonuclease
VPNFTEEEQKASWDYNQITPGKELLACLFISLFRFLISLIHCLGTPFMQHVAECLQFYIRHKLSTDPAWKNLTCFLSDSNVPGME